MKHRYLTPRANNKPLLFGINIPGRRGGYGGMSGMWVDWDYVDKHMSKSFLKFILFFNVLMLVLFISFFGDNFLKSAHDSIYELVFLVIVVIVYVVGRDSFRLMYYLRTSKIIRRSD